MIAGNCSAWAVVYLNNMMSETEGFNVLAALHEPLFPKYIKDLPRHASCGTGQMYTSND